MKYCPFGRDYRRKYTKKGILRKWGSKDQIRVNMGKQDWNKEESKPPSIRVLVLYCEYPTCVYIVYLAPYRTSGLVVERDDSNN